MSNRERGDRVGAILSKDGGVVKFLGYGEYKGDEVPPENTGGFGPLIHESGRTNPKIELDNGSVVWGCECWWGDEEKIRETVENSSQVNRVDIEDYRQ